MWAVAVHIRSSPLAAMDQMRKAIAGFAHFTLSLGVRDGLGDRCGWSTAVPQVADSPLVDTQFRTANPVHSRHSTNRPTWLVGH